MEFAELKFRADGTPVVAGYGVVYGERDLEGDTFTPETKFGAMADLPVFYDHAQQSVKALDNEIGRVVSVKADDKGLWFEAEIDKAHEYADQVLELVKRGVVGLSTGAVSHLVRRDERKALKRWPIAELSLTVTPAEPRTIGITQIKATSGSEAAAEGAAEGESQSVSVQPEAPVAVIRSEVADEGGPTMAEEIKGAAEQPEIKALSDRIDQLMALVENSPLKSAGYVTMDGGTADRNIKSFGDFLLAVKRGDVKRLEKHYGAVKAMNEDAGATGGYLVPEEYERRVIELAYRQEPWLAKVTRFQVGAAGGRWPSMDVTFTPTAGSGTTAAAGKLAGVKRAEAGAFAETTPNFTELEWKVNDVISGYVKVSKELAADSMIAVEQLLTRLIATADAAKQAYYFLQGNGTNEPLGILNSGAYLLALAATNNVFAVADAYQMISQFQPIEGGMWVAHRTNMPDIGAVVSSTGLAYTNDANRQPGTIPILGYDVAWSEHLPVTDNSGSLLLIDPSAYYVWERGGLEIAFSEHADFTNGNVIWRFSRRLDGQPAFKSTIKLSNPGTAHQVSPFVGFKFATS
jgi:HK97 family phage major capsid protein/HK97 family phage prohead protease